MMIYLKAIGFAEYAGFTPKFCENFCIRYKAMLEINKLRHQLIHYGNEQIQIPYLIANYS